MDKSVADLIDLVISDGKKFWAFIGLIVSCGALLLLLVWLIPILLHVSTSKLTVSSKGSEIELKASTPTQDQYYLVVSPQASWQPTHIYLKKGSKFTIIADGRVNIDLHGLHDEIERRIKLEGDMEKLHPGLRADPKHTPEEYFSEKDWQSLIPRHYWSGPQGDFVIAPTSFTGRQGYKLAPDLSFGALLGTIMTREDVDSNGEPPVEAHDIFLVGNRWPDPKKEEGSPSSGWLWLGINDVVERASDFPNAKGIRVPDIFLLDNLGFYRVVVTIPN